MGPGGNPGAFYDVSPNRHAGLHAALLDLLPPHGSQRDRNRLVGAAHNGRALVVPLREVQEWSKLNGTQSASWERRNRAQVTKHGAEIDQSSQEESGESRDCKATQLPRVQICSALGSMS